MKKQDFISHINTWESEGLITHEQSLQMIDDVTLAASERSGNFFVSSLMYMGAFALSLGALLFIASNWSYFGKEFKLILSLLLPIIPLTYAYFGLVVHEKKSVLPRVANISGVILIGGTLALIAQIYNLEVNYVSFWWTWAIMTLPFVFIFRQIENVVFSSTVVGVAFFYWLVTLLERSTLSDSDSILIMTVAALLYSGLLYGLGSLARQLVVWSDSARLLRMGGANLLIVTLFLTTFEFYARALTDESYSRWNTGADATNYWMPISIALNIVFIITLVWFLVRSIRAEEYQVAFSIVRLFGFYLIVKYFTLFFTMFDTGLFFMIGGAVFITGGWLLEKQKTTLIDFFKRTAESHPQS